MPTSIPPFSPELWRPRLRTLATLLRQTARTELTKQLASGLTQRPIGQGVGDVTYALDAATERVLEHWHHVQAAVHPLSLFTEDNGWRHLGPSPTSGTRTLPNFNHGGARLMVDPVDGTRNLMADLRSAWTVLSLCGPGTIQPQLLDVQLGLISELPDTRAANYRIFSGERDHGAHFEERTLQSDTLLHERPLVADTDDRPDHGYFSVFRYTPAMRPVLAHLEADFFARLQQHENADLRSCFDDQYISNGGQLALLSLGTYRMIADLRAHYAPSFNTPVTTSKAYDCAGAILVAQEAGCSVKHPDGSTLNFPLDGTSGVSFVGFANQRSAARLGPHLRAAL